MSPASLGSFGGHGLRQPVAVVLGSVSQQGTRRCSATESHTAVGRVAAQHFCLLSDREDGAVLVERTHCGAQTSAGAESPPDGGDEELQQRPPAYVHRCHGSFSQNKYLRLLLRGKKICFHDQRLYSLRHIEQDTPPHPTLQTYLSQISSLDL